MRAARYYGEKDLRIEQIPEPECKPGHVKLAPAFCGICGTDIHEWDGGPTFAPKEGHPHGVTKETIPIGFGHEFSGTVLEVGEGVEGLIKGQHVAVKPILTCAACPACDDGIDGACDSVGFVGLSGGGGGLAEAVVVPKHMVFPLPDNVPLEYGALVEPLAVGWHATTLSEMKANDRVLILGGGPIGLAVLQAVKARKAGLIIVAEVTPARQKFARQFGADHVINPLEEDTVAATRKLCGNRAADVVFDCAGVPASINAACEAIKARGTVVNVAIWEREIPFQPNRLVFREAKYIGVLGYLKEDYESVIEALGSGSIDPKGMITKTIGLENVVEGGIKTIMKEKDNHIKIMVDLKT